MTTLFRPNRLRGVGAHILRIVPLLFSAMLVLLLPACENDNKNNSPINTGDDETTITFSVSVPNGFTPTSYGFSKDDEEYLSTVDVLLFNGTTFVSGPHYGVINRETKSVTIRIPDTNGTYTMAVFGNCRSAINGKTFSGENKTTIYGNLTVDNSAKWNTTVSSQVPASPIPMWGEASVTVSGGTVSGTVSVSLVRMLARVNVANNADNFKLTSVRVYNYNKSGRVAPADGKVTITGGATPTVTVTGTSLPTNPDKETNTANPLVYTVTDGNKGYEYENEIYLFEADVKTPAANSKPCLVIGGEYSGGSTTYYRIDLADATGGNLSYFDLYRNYSYNVAINNISGAGAANAADAFSSTPINIQYSVTEWNDSDITQVVAGGTTLGVSQGEFNFTKGAANATLTVNTNNADGWTAKVLDADGTTEKTNDIGFWLQINNTSGSTGNTDVALSVTSNNSDTRTAFIKITAGTIVYTVKVVQSDSDISLLIDGQASNKEIILVAPVSTAFSSKSFTLKWAPATSPVYYSGSGTGLGNFTFDGSAILGGQVLASGEKQITVQTPTFSGGTPTPSAPLVDGATASVSYVLYGLSRTVNLKQQVWDVFIENSSNASIVNGSLSFEAVNGVIPAAQTITLYAPVGSTVSWSGNTNFNITGNSTTSTVSTSYSVQPKAALTNPATNSNSVTCTITYPASEGSAISKTFTLNQSAVAPYLTHTAADYYLLDGGSKSFTISTNVAWKIKSVTAKVIQGGSGTSTSSFLSSEGDLTTTKSGAAGENITIGFTAKTAQLGGTVTVVFASQTPGQFEDVKVILPFAGTKAGVTAATDDIKWAGSNIYYDKGAGHLTFAPYDSSTGITDAERYQGVYFQWGSLYGIAATGSSSSFTTSGTNATLIFPPWGGVVAFDNAALQDKGITTWDAIPRVTTSLSASNGNNFLYYRTDDISAPESAAKGDICRWLTLTNRAPAGNWRMPTATEMTASRSTWPIDLLGTENETGWSSTTPGNSEDNIYGKNSISVGRHNTNPFNGSKPFFPAAGGRPYSSGVLAEVGSTGHYWASSPNGSNARRLNFNSSDVNSSTSSTSARTTGFTVRCVQDN